MSPDYSDKPHAVMAEVPDSIREHLSPNPKSIFYDLRAVARSHGLGL
ncbi:hypothetical protein [Microcoleus sp. S36bC1]